MRDGDLMIDAEDDPCYVAKGEGYYIPIFWNKGMTRLIKSSAIVKPVNLLIPKELM